MTEEYKKKEEKLIVEPEEKESYVRDYISGGIVKANPEEIEAVQIFSKILVEDYGYPKKLIQTRPQFRVKTAPSGEEKYPVDIVIFNSEKRNYNNVYIIIECKRKEKKDGKKQLDIYLNLVPSVELGVWFNGKEHLYLRKIIDKKTGTVGWEEIPDIPKFGQRIEDIGLYNRKDLQKTQNLKAIFNDIRNHLAGNVTGITRDESIAQEIINLLFCKIYDEVNTSPTDQITFRAGADENKNEIKERIINLFDKVKRDYDDVFEDTDVIKLDAESIVYVVGTLQKYEITTAERDVIGDAFEVFIGPALRGSEGQFFTPRNVVKMAVEILSPRPGEYIIDPACGSGGFLIVALESVWNQLAVEAKKKNWSEAVLANKRREIATKFFAGIDKDSFLAKVTKAYMAIIGDGRGGIFCENTLLPLSEWNNKAQDRIKLNKFNVLLTNPPFGAKIPVRGDRILSQYSLGYKWKKEDLGWVKTNKLSDKQPPQILFIERCLELLAEGGRMAIVLPEGIFGNVSDGYIRKFILDKAILLAVIDVPSETFSPSTTTKTSLLFLKKKKQNEKKINYPIFMAIADKCGHDRRGKAISQDDLPIISKEYHKFMEENGIDF